MWLQYDFGDGPVIDGRKTVLFCAWLAWSRFRVVLALRDRTAPTVFAALDVTLRKLGGAPTYVLTDNEKTVTTGHIAGMAVRNRQVLSFARFYGVTVHTCEPADPASKGGSESTVKLAKADLVPTDTDLSEAYDTFGQFETACEVFCDEVNARVHRVTRRAPVEMLAGACPAAPAAGRPSHGRVRAVTHGPGTDADDGVGRREVLRAAPADGSAGLDPGPRPRPR